ncbi:MAG: outer rane usher protein [Sphingomonadales bacterium]|nr:outer rane usher protein [Sphingomonadales bacterium]
MKGEFEREPALLAVSVNGMPSGESVLLFKDADGRFYAPEDALIGWRMKRGIPAFSQDGTNYYSLSDIAGLTLDLVATTQTLLVSAAPGLFEPTRLPVETGGPGPMTRSDAGGFVNYDLLAQLAGDGLRMNGDIEVGAFTSLGIGVSRFVGRWGGGDASLVRLETNWTRDDPVRMRSLRVGDSITRGGVGGGPLRFAGIQIARNFAVQPGFVTLPLPSLSGSAAVPSVVDIYVNNALRSTREVQPGPFEIVDIPIVTGSGEVQLVVRDLLGRETVVRQSFYSAPQSLRRGLHDYSYELGFLRRDFGRRSNAYGEPVVSATHRYGFTDTFTGELHLEATGGVQTAGLGANLLLPGVGLLDISVAGSRSGEGQGAQIGLGFERRAAGLSLGITAELTTERFASVASLSGRPPPAAIVQAFAGVPLGSGSVGVSYLWRAGRNEPDVEFASANASLRLGSLGTLHLAGRKSLKDPKGVAVELLLAVPIGRRTSATAGAELRGGSATVTTALQRNLPSGEGLGYRAAMVVGDSQRFDARLSAQTGFGAYDAELSWTDGRSGVRVVASGGIGAVGNRVFASRRLSQSFAVVQVGDYPGVRVYADNQLVDTTDRKGRAVVPRLRPFDRNPIRIEALDLPLDTQLPAAEKVVRPYNRSGVAVDFGVRKTLAAMLRIVLDDGRPLEAGALVRVEGRAEEFVSAPGGEVYLTGLTADNIVQASWTGGTCSFRLPFAKTSDPQPRLGEFRCQSPVH